MNKKVKIILVHLLGGLAFLSVPLLFLPGPPLGIQSFYNPIIQKETLVFFFLILFFYANYYLFIPQLYFRRKFFIFIIVLVLSYLVISFLPQIILFKDLMPPMSKRPRHHSPLLFELGRHFFHFLVVAILSVTLKINEQWRQSQKEKIAAELDYLKAQINPHFLFNTLNSIYSLAIQKSDETPEAIVKLSGLMRYVITDAANETVPLDKEVGYIDDYIRLQQLRLGDTVSLEFSKDGDFQTNVIAPLLLIPFVENAFKFGVNPGETSYIRIRLNLENETLHFNVVNKKLMINVIKHQESGIGIENTLSRLNLLYPSEHEIKIDDGIDEYKVDLVIRLK
jgi:hypothetical protein